MRAVPADVKRILKKIEEAGYRAYITGGSLRDLLRGREPADWDLSTTAPPETVSLLFPEADRRGMPFGVVRVRDGALEADVASLRKDGAYFDYRRPSGITFTNCVEEDLMRRDFGMNAMAMGTDGRIIDPFGGQKQIQKKLIQAVGNPEDRFREDPLRILRGLRLAAELDFDLEAETFHAMEKTSSLLHEVSPERRRTEFERLISAEHAGKGLRMCTAAGVMPALIGGCFPPPRSTEHGSFEMLLQNIDLDKQRRTRPDLRIALLFLCCDQKKSMQAIDDLHYDRHTADLMKCAQKHLSELHLASGSFELKRFIYLHGWEAYAFLNELTKMQRDIFHISPFRIESRYYILQEIKKNNEPIFVRDLAIDGNDLKEAGIAEGERIGEILKLLTETVHRYPGLNTREKLLKKAKSMKNPWIAKLKSLNWTR
ncbi:MAG: hypothetical protein SOY83_01245 [Anaerovoracaceae bacterium]|nr:hypothetical protein [Bacillota bacterium]MDY3954099.1 hypothetical protein [Anaerovoracaceae bacterium]